VFLKQKAQIFTNRALIAHWQKTSAYPNWA